MKIFIRQKLYLISHKMTFINFYIYKTIRELYKFKKEHKSKIFYQNLKKFSSLENLLEYLRKIL